MSDDALAALVEALHQKVPWLDAPCVRDGESCGGRCGSQKVIDVLFPPDHPLRTGEPSDQLCYAIRDASGGRLTCNEAANMARAALAVLLVPSPRRPA